jgi:hypothetical protein
VALERAIERERERAVFNFLKLFYLKLFNFKIIIPIGELLLPFLYERVVAVVCVCLRESERAGETYIPPPFDKVTGLLLLLLLLLLVMMMMMMIKKKTNKQEEERERRNKLARVD